MSNSFLLSLRKFVSLSFIYTLINVFNKFVPFILFPIIIRMVSVQEYGIYSLLLSLEFFLIPIVSINVHSALSTHYFKSDFKPSNYLSTSIFFILFSLFFFFFCFFLIPYNFYNHFNIPREFIFIILFTSAMNGLVNLLSVFFRLENKPLSYGFLIVGNSILIFCSILFFVYFYTNSALSLLLGRFFSFLLLAIVVIFFLIRNSLFTLYFNKNLFKQISKFSLPTIFFSISAISFIVLDRFFINHFLNEAMVGYYSAFYQLASIISVIYSSFNAAWIPWLFENLKKEDITINNNIVKFSYFLMFIFIFIGIIYSFFFEIVASIILVPDFLKFSSIGYPLIFGFVFQGLYFIVSPYISYSENTKYLAYGGVLISILSVALNLFLIPMIGLIGAAYSNLLSWMFLFFYTFYLSNKAYSMPWLSIRFK